MPLTAGIVGLPNVGKSTLFNAITHSQVEAANYPFATIQPNKGIVEVSDPRLTDLTQRFVSQKTIAATFEFTDIAGLVRGASKGEGLGNQFLAHIREVDAICHVVRCFENAEIIHVDGTVDPLRDIETVNFELIFADLETVEKRLARSGKRALVNKDKEAIAETEVLEPIKAVLLQGKPARMVTFRKDQLPIVHELHLLTMKPTIYVANLGEDEVRQPEENPHFRALQTQAKAEGADLVPICAQIEADLSVLEDDERNLFLQELGVEEAGLDQLIHTAYQRLGLATFFTAGPKESRAWTFRRGMSAAQCAGIIHTDFERGFIRAEVYSYADLVKYGSEAGIKENGRFRIEGRDYEMQDGDIIHIRFNI